MERNLKFSKKWIIQNHSLNEIRVWHQELNYFSYFRAFGGHMNDGDSFKMCLKFKNIEELLEIINSLGFYLNKSILRLKTEYDILTPEYEKIKEYPEYIKPKHQKLIKADWFLLIDNNSLIISIAGTGLEHNYGVTNKDFEKCVEFEKLIKKLRLNEKIDPMFNYKPDCISIESYPNLFKDIK